MKFTLALLAVLAVCGSGSIIRPKESQPKNRVEQEWESSIPEISNPKIQVPMFSDGHEYRYLWDSQILTGMPNVHYQFSGARIRAIVKIQLGQKDLMQIEKVFVGSLHERFVSDPQTLIELSAFEPAKEQDAPFEEVLKKPVRFSYENGKVDDLEFAEGDPSWSINIKRSILATFHLSLTDREEPKCEERRKELYGDRDATGRSNEVSPRRPPTTGDNTEYFTVMEDGIGGRCEVSYLVMEIPDKDEEVYPIEDVAGEQARSSGSSGSPREGRVRGPRATPTGEDFNVLNVTKTFDYRNCEFRPFIFKGLHLSTACPNCDEDPESFFDLLESSAHTRYNITGTPEKYLIDSAITEAVYKVTPRSHYAGSMVAYANVTAVLIKAGPISGQINFPEQNSVEIDGLHMIDPHFIRKEGDKILYDSPETSRPIWQKPEYWPNVANKPTKVKALFEKLVQGMEQKDGKEIDTETAVIVREIIWYMKYAFTTELEQIHNAIKSVSAPGIQKEEVEHLFADLLVATGTNCTFTYVKRLLTEKKLEGPVVQDVLALLPFKMKPNLISEDTLEEWMDMCEDEDLKTDPFVERACWLSFGTIVHKACQHSWYGAQSWKEAISNRPETGKPSSSRRPRATPSDEGMEDLPERCPTELRQKIIQKATDALKSADSDEKKILAIKTIGNMGFNETVDELEEIIEDESIPIYIRTQAIYALKYPAIESPELVYDILLPTYRDTSNPTQIRIAAMVVLLASRPDLPVLEDIAQSLNREIDLDVASYTYSTMTSLANSTDPCLKNLTRDLILALEHAKPVNVDGRHSKGCAHGKWVNQMKRGIFWEVNHIMDRDAPVPKAGNFRLHTNVMGKSMDLVEVIFETEGMGDNLRKYAGNLTRESLDEVLSGRAGRRPRQSGSQDSTVPEVNEINGLLNFPPQPPKELRGTATLKLFGQTTRFAVLNPQTVSRFIVEMISQSQNVIPKLTGEGLPMDQRRATTLLDVRVEFPTVLGMPISATAFAPIVASMKGKLKVNMEPKPTEGFSMLKTTPQRLMVQNDVKTSIAAEIHTKLNVFLGFMKVGTGVRAKLSFNAPVSGKLEFSLKDKMTKVTMDMPDSPFKLAKVESYPVTYVIHYSKKDMTFQPRSTPSTSNMSPRRWTSDDHSEESMESGETQRHPRPTPQTPHGDHAMRHLNLNITDVHTDMITEHGHAVLKTLTGLPMPQIELWEIPTPMFVKSRKVHFQIGHESIAAKIELKSKMEYPDTRIPTALLPVVGAKCEMEIKVTPKPGQKKITITAFERSEFTHKMSEKDLMNKLKDKVPDMTIKELSTSNQLPKVDTDKLAKMGHSLQVLVNSEGTDAPDAWTTRGLLAVVYTMDGRYVKFIAGMNSKLPTFPKKLCLTAEVRKPERNNMWFVTPQQPLNKSVQGNLEASWGDDCGTDKQYLKLRLRVQKTKEQMEIEKNDLYDENGIPVPLEVAHEVREGEGLFNSLYKQCEEDRQRGAYFSKECVDFVIRYTDLLRLKMDIEYKNVSRPIRGILAKAERLVKYWYYWNTDVMDVDVHNPENRVNALIDFSADRSYVDIKYQTPRSNVSIINWDLPMDVQPLSTLVPWTPARLFGLAMPISCTLSGPKINTFDDVSDEMPLSQCWHVLTKDESEENLFAVLVAAAGKNTIAKKVAVVFPGHRIEILPTGSISGNPQNPPSIKSFHVKYNGQEVKDVMTTDKHVTIPLNTPEEKEELATIMLLKPEETGNKEPIIGIFSRPTGIKVLFDGSSVTVVPSPLWKNNLVGLCGSFDGQTWDDKLLPNKTLVEEPEELSRAFLLNTRGCDQTIEVYPPVPGSSPSKPKRS